MPPVICLHGLGGTALSFIEMAEEFESNYHLVAATIPGSAGTMPFPEQQDYSMSNLTSWLDELVCALEFPSFNIVGHSWGAQLALFYLNAHPSKVNQCILIDGGYYRREVTNPSGPSVATEIASVIESDNDYSFASIEEYLECEKQGVKSWNAAKEKAALDRVIDDVQGTKWHLSNKVTDWALSQIYEQKPHTIYESIREQNLGARLTLLRTTEPKERIDRQALAKEFITQTGGQLIEMIGCTHSMILDTPARVSTEVGKILNS